MKTPRGPADDTEQEREQVSPPSPLRRLEWHNFSDVLDPLGAKLDHYGGLQDIPAPKNHEFAWAGLPFTAHTGFWRNEKFLDWFVRRVLPDETETTVTAPSWWSRSWRLGLGFAYFLVFGSVMLWFFVFVISLLLGTLEDFHTNAESQTAYFLLQPLAVLLAFIREHFGLFPGTLQSLLWGLLRAAFYFTLGSFAWSATAYYRRERRARSRGA